MELSGSNINKFQEKENPKKILYISGNGNPKNLLIFQEVPFRARKIKRTHS